MGQKGRLLADPSRPINNKTRVSTLSARRHSARVESHIWSAREGEICRTSQHICLPCTPREFEVLFRPGRSAIRPFGPRGHARRDYLHQSFLPARGAILQSWQSKLPGRAARLLHVAASLHAKPNWVTVCLYIQDAVAHRAGCQGANRLCATSPHIQPPTSSTGRLHSCILRP